MHSPRPIFSIKYIEWNGDIPNILYTSITNVGNVLQCARWEGRIAWIITIHKIHIIISRWLCGFRLTVCRRERPLLHLWSATLDGQKDERSWGKKFKQRKRNEFKAVNWDESTISCQQAFPVVVDCFVYAVHEFPTLTISSTWIIKFFQFECVLSTYFISSLEWEWETSHITDNQQQSAATKTSKLATTVNNSLKMSPSSKTHPKVCSQTIMYKSPDWWESSSKM